MSEKTDQIGGTETVPKALAPERIGGGGAERWATLFDGDYEVSTLGRVRRATRGYSTKPGRIVKPMPNKGYLYATLSSHGCPRQFGIHRLVAMAFLGPCPSGYVVNHIDGDRGNNSLGNLEYLSSQDNVQHAMRTGLSLRGEKHPLSKLTEAQVREIRDLAAKGLTVTAVARLFGIGQGTASRIILRKSWKHVL